MMTPRPYQEKSIQELLAILKPRRYAVDGSDCGTGKTLVAVEVIRRVGIRACVVCPKATIPGWERHAAAQGVTIDVMNWEMVRTGRTVLGKWLPKHNPKAPDVFEWNKALVSFLIFDELHRAMSYHSKNGAMVRAAKRQRIPALGLTATLADSPLELDATGYLLGLHDGEDKPTLRNPTPTGFFDWARKHNCRYEFLGGWDFYGKPEERQAVMRKIHGDIYPKNGVRVRIADLGDQFPETHITAELYSLGDEERVNALYEKMRGPLELLAKSKETDIPGHILTDLLRDRQEIELIKAPVIADLARDYNRQGMSCAIFVNFSATLEYLCEELQTLCFIDGTQAGAKGAANREANRVDFQTNRERNIVCNGGAGGVGIDLHDETGDFPRVALISPGFNAKELVQILGRIHRQGGKSKSLQRIICAAGTVETSVFHAFNGKVNNLDTLNDGDLVPRFVRL